MLNRIAFAAGLLVMLSALPLAVQLDRISGMWASDSRPLLELKMDGGSVSGTVHFYEGASRRASASIESASFDERTAALRLTGRVVVPDGRTLPYVIEGALKDESLQVNLTLDGVHSGSQVLRRTSGAADGSSVRRRRPREASRLTVQEQE